MTCIINLCTIASAIFSIAACIIAWLAYRFATTTYKESVDKQRVQATLSAFPQIRKENGELILEMADLEGIRERELLIKRYMSQMEHFAVGINEGAYDIAAVNRMSGGMLVTQYEKYIRDFITMRKEKPQKNLEPGKKYCEYETMMKKLFELRGKPWED